MITNNTSQLDKVMKISKKRLDWPFRPFILKQTKIISFESVHVLLLTEHPIEVVVHLGEETCRNLQFDLSEMRYETKDVMIHPLLNPLC